MSSEVSVLSKDGSWKADVEAWKNNFLAYKSIGTQVTVYHREPHKNVWGNTVTDWVEKPATTITIENTYKGTGPGVATRTKTCTNASYCELKEWAVGVSIELPPDSITDVHGAAVLDLDSVSARINVVVGSEVMNAQVSASSIVSDSGIW